MTSDSPKLVFTVNNYYASYVIYDCNQKKIVNSVKNPSGLKIFYGAFTVEDTPLVILRDGQHFDVMNVETNQVYNLLPSIFNIDFLRFTTYWVERQDSDLLHIYALEYSSLTKASQVRKVTRSVKELLELTTKQ